MTQNYNTIIQTIQFNVSTSGTLENTIALIWLVPNIKCIIIKYIAYKVTPSQYIYKHIIDLYSLAITYT